MVLLCSIGAVWCYIASPKASNDSIGYTLDIL